MHGEVAETLLRNYSDITFTDTTLDRFAALIDALNATKGTQPQQSILIILTLRERGLGIAREVHALTATRGGSRVTLDGPPNLRDAPERGSRYLAML